MSASGSAAYGTRTADAMALGHVTALLAAALRSAHESSGLSMSAILRRWERESRAAGLVDADAFIAILEVLPERSA